MGLFQAAVIRQKGSPEIHIATLSEERGEGGDPQHDIINRGKYVKGDDCGV